MHVAVVTPSFPSRPDQIEGGVMGAVKHLVDELVRYDDIELSIVVLTGKPGEAALHGSDKCKVYTRGTSRWSSILPGTLYEIASGKRAAFRLLRRLSPDLVHFQGCEYLAANCEFPHVLTIHGIKELDALWRSSGAVARLKWRLLKTTEEYGRRTVPNVILISEYVRRFLAGSRRLKRSWLIENPIADSFFDVGWAAERGRILASSGVRPLKNILGLIEAFAVLSPEIPESQLRIAGSTALYPEYVRECKECAARNGIEGRVHFLGNVGIREVQQELSKSNCLVIPSFQESAPLAVEEAMAVGVPVVGSKVGGLPHMIEDGKTGFLIDPNDTRGIADAVGRVIADAELAAKMSRRAKAISSDRFRASNVARLTRDVYLEVLGGGSPRN